MSTSKVGLKTICDKCGQPAPARSHRTKQPVPIHATVNGYSFSIGLETLTPEGQRVTLDICYDCALDFLTKLADDMGVNDKK